MNRGHFLAEQRKRKGLSQNDIAFRLGYTPQLVSLWEANKAVPDLSIISKYASILGVDLEGFIECKNKRDNTRCDYLEFDIQQFSINLKYQRVKNNFIQSDLAKRTLVNKKTVGSWEQGSSTPNLMHFISLCNLLKLSYDELYFAFLEQENEHRKPLHKKRTFIPIFLPILVVVSVSGTTTALIAIDNARQANNKPMFTTSSVTDSTESIESIESYEDSESISSSEESEHDSTGSESHSNESETESIESIEESGRESTGAESHSSESESGESTYLDYWVMDWGTHWHETTTPGKRVDCEAHIFEEDTVNDVKRCTVCGTTDANFDSSISVMGATGDDGNNVMSRAAFEDINVEVNATEDIYYLTGVLFKIFNDDFTYVRTVEIEIPGLILFNGEGSHGVFTITAEYLESIEELKTAHNFNLSLVSVFIGHVLECSITNVFDYIITD